MSASQGGQQSQPPSSGGEQREQSAVEKKRARKPSKEEQAMVSGQPEAKVVQKDPAYGEFVNEAEDAYEKGYWGVRETPFSDEEFTVASGPNSPVTDLAGRPLDVDPDEHIQKSPPDVD
jgi:hypothetical protein